MQILRTVLCAFMAVLVAVPVQVAAAPESHTFELEHRRAAEVLPQLRDLYKGADVTFSPDGQTLMVRAEAEQLAEIDQLLHTLDEPARQIRVMARRRETASESKGGGSKKTHSTTRDSVRSITVKGGQMARIDSGKVTRIPVAVRGGEDPTAILEEVDLSSGFLVRPSVISDNQVELQITALHRQSIDDVTDYHQAGVVTVRRVTPGEWVALGGESSEHRSREGSRVYSTSSGNNSRIWEVKVEVLEQR